MYKNSASPNFILINVMLWSEENHSLRPEIPPLHGWLELKFLIKSDPMKGTTHNHMHHFASLHDTCMMHGPRSINRKRQGCPSTKHGAW